MKPSEFQTTIENQFDYICKVAMDDERKDYFKALSRQCKRETLFCDMDNYTVNLFSSEDTYPSHFHTFEMDGFTVRIENSLLAEALENLDGKKNNSKKNPILWKSAGCRFSLSCQICGGESVSHGMGI